MIERSIEAKDAPDSHVQTAWLHFARTLPPRGGWERANMDLAAKLSHMAYEELGAQTNVGPDFYQVFVDQDDVQMEALVAAVTHGVGPAIEAVREAVEDGGDELVAELVKACLYLVARGYVIFSQDAGVTVFALPSGPPPGLAMEQAIVWRIEAVDQLLGGDRLRRPGCGGHPA